ncbi:MAG: MFS transporter [Candidatus Ryanbacteria bacterium]|nr:MFS transporter [Candidatus Ryanbacteria bacterium]
MKKITYIQFAIYFAMGLFTPAWLKIILGQGNSLETFGLLFGLMSLGSIVSAYLVGWACEGRNPLKILSWTLVLQGSVMLAYLIPNAPLYVLQALFGALEASLVTLQQILIAHYSNGATGKIGVHNSFVQAAIGFSMIGGGFLALWIGASTVILFSVAILFITAIGVRVLPPSVDR